jgi:tripartite ATP-independent transporter DctP family solute receptor
MKFIRRHLCHALAALPLALALASPAQAAEVKERNIKLSVITALDTPLGIGAKKFAELVGAKSEGKLKVKVYGDGTLGGEQQMISSLQGGTVEATIVLPGALTGVVKSYSVLDLPFVFEDEQQAARVLDGPVGTRLMSYLPEKGLVGLGFMELGFRHYTNSKRPITKVEDFAGLKLRSFQNPVFIDLTTALGANPLPLSFTELYTAMEQKTVDGQENSFATIDVAKFYEVQKYISPTRHVYAAQLILVGRKFWDTLSADERRIMQDAAKEAIVFQRTAARELDAKARDDLRKKGMVFSEITPQEMARFRERTKPVVDKHAALLPEDLRKEFFSELAKARQSKP